MDAGMSISNLPTGTVTFLFTDIEGSTQLWERYPDQTRVALLRHDQIIEEVVERHGGSLVRPRGEGDSRFAVFSLATDAVAAAAAMQQALYSEYWPTHTPLRVRMALHTGEADLRERDYYGSAVNRCARLRSAAHGGQTLLSHVIHDLVRDSILAGTGTRIELRDLGEHLLRDLQQPEHIFQLVIPGLPSDFPPLKTLDAHPHNLPCQRSPLVGREAEVATVQRLLLRDEVGLLTLTGPGGIGKTRLALQVAAEAVDEFQDGVYFVSLAHITDPTLVAPAIAQTLGVKQVAGRDIVDALEEYLREKRLLLLLDNFEQVVAAATLVVKLLGAALLLKVLVTSREVLHVRDEQEFPVPPLGVPDPKHLPPVGAGLATAIAQYEAVALFIQRARLVKPDFGITNEDAPAVAEICYRLDGLPLAIELAAARIRLFSPPAMLSRLGSRLRLLTSGARDIPERQQTLRSTIRWSYDLLDEGEQKLFRRMSVFVGGATLEAIEAICIDPELAKDQALDMDVLDGVASLVDKSLVRQETGTTLSGQAGPFGTIGMESEPRFGMLQTIREFAIELLQSTDPTEREELHRQHAQYYLALAEQGWTGMQGQQQEQWLYRLEVEYGNLQAVMKRAVEQGEAQTALRLSAALWAVWGFREYNNESIKWLGEALEMPGAEVRNQAQALALMGAASVSVNQADLVSARAYSEESVAIYRELRPEERRDLGLALALYGYALAFSAEHEAGGAAMEEGLLLLRQARNKWGLSFALLMQGLVANAQGDLASARTAFEESAALSREVGNGLVLSQALNGLGDVSRIMGDYPRAKELYEESLSLFRRLNLRSDIPASLHNLGHVALAQGKIEDAKKLFIEALRLHLTLKNRVGIAECLAGLAGVAGAEKQPERAARLFGAAEALREGLGARVWPAEQADHERNLSNARAQLSIGAWEKAWQEGRAMSVEQAIAYALGETTTTADQQA
jgi:predicted ATPase/class 3 adenylate cyclase